MLELTLIDRDNSIVPIWHDESYLNWFSANFDHNSIPPTLCSDGKLDKYIDLDFRIVAVDKEKIFQERKLGQFNNF